MSLQVLVWWARRATAHQRRWAGGGTAAPSQPHSISMCPGINPAGKVSAFVPSRSLCREKEVAEAVRVGRVDRVIYICVRM